MNSTIWRSVIAGAATALSLCFQQLAVPVAILLIVMLADYVSGLAKASVNRTLCSRTGIQGILKKIGGLFVVGVGLVTDYIVGQAASSLGVEIGVNYAIGLLVTFWLIVNELISILENVSEIGVPLPAFLQGVIDRLKITIENKAEE
ncbi:MAG: phage holin family protein [Clostridia bacterium]|nr:phage holin family protein [Clostridia bacterium]